MRSSRSRSGLPCRSSPRALRRRAVALGDIQHKIRVTQGKIGKRKGTERLLTTQISAYSQRIGRLQARIGTLQSQQSTAQADLDAKRDELFKTQRDLRAERRRLVRLRARLAQARDGASPSGSSSSTRPTSPTSSR